MKIAVLKEKVAGELRVAIHPETVKKFIKLGFEVCIETGAGINSSITDDHFAEAGAKISKVPLEILADADIILKVQPSPKANKTSKKDFDELNFMTENTIIIGMLSPYNNEQLFKKYNDKKITSLAMEMIPRITRAQTMDALSSQSNLAGYKAVIDAAAHFNKILPMMTTAAGTIKPAKALILGAGVAGLQAIATAKRLGAIVSAFDVRSIAKEQVESLGAKFIEVESHEEGSASGGYAKEMSKEYQQKQTDLIHETLKTQDIVITTAQIPGKPSPKLISKKMIEDMQPGSIIVDLAALGGGNTEITKLDKIVTHKDVTIIGYGNYPSRIANHASYLYANNLYNLVNLIFNKESKKLELNFEDEIIKKSCITHNGKFYSDLFAK